MKKLFFDMDGTLVDFQSGIDKLSGEDHEKFRGHYDDCPGIFALMEPMQGAITAVKNLCKKYDCYILSTSPWNNPDAWADKVRWIQKYLGEELYKKVILTHHKELLDDGDSLLIDDRTAHGANAFGDRHIHFRSDRFPDWNSVIEYLMNK